MFKIILQDHTQLNNGNCYGGTGNGEVDNSMNPLDNMAALHQYLNELMRTGTDLNGDLMNKGKDTLYVFSVLQNFFFIVNQVTIFY